MADRSPGRIFENDGKKPKCELDNNGCLQLSAIVHSFTAPISEEQAWAVAYQTAKCLWCEWQNNSRGSCLVLEDTKDVLIHKDGFVHPDTIRGCTEGTTRNQALSEQKLVSSLGLVVFQALDYGLMEDEERNLSEPLEILIDRMTSADPDAASTAEDSSDDEDAESQNADEGIERDSGEDDMSDSGSNKGKEQNGLSLRRVMEMCAEHLSSPSQADNHYKAVCRALVAEALELSTFLETISSGTMKLDQSTTEEVDGAGTTLETLKFSDWARLWMQVIRELRQGVKLKKVDSYSHRPPIEFELTPYEMLLDDIRSRRYKLNKVMVNGDIPPKIKKDAHALILEFIRSRPPLVPASKRKLNPAPNEPPTLYDKLMASIKQKHNLKPTSQKPGAVDPAKQGIKATPVSNNEHVQNLEQKQQQKPLPQQQVQPTQPQAVPQRRLIKADLSLNFDNDDDDDDLPPSPEAEPFMSLPAKLDESSSPTKAPPAENGSPWHKVALDHRSLTVGFKSDRRHSMPAYDNDVEYTNSSRLHQNGNLQNGKGGGGVRFGEIMEYEPQKVDTDGYWDTSLWERSFECLSLSLEEVVHIRNVLTKAELESLIVDKSLYDDVEKGKVCFTCKTTKFSFFGPWAVKCKLCERMVCEKCSTKMRIPTEHFAKIPVYMLSPTPSPPPSEEDLSLQSLLKFPESLNIISSAPGSPNLSARHKKEESLSPQPGKRPPLRQSKSINVELEDDFDDNSKPASSPARAPLNRTLTIQQQLYLPIGEKLSGPLAKVCRDCKEIIWYILVAACSGGISPHTPEDERRSSISQHVQKSCAASCLSPSLASPDMSPKHVAFHAPKADLSSVS